MGSHRHLDLWVSPLSQAMLENSTVSFITTPPTKSAKCFMAPIRPSIALTVAMITTILSVTVLLLLCAKYCKPRGGRPYRGNLTSSEIPASSPHRHSGVDRAVVDSLPVFRFGALRGHKDGLECSVCLNRFEPAEVLRLLPKCKHAFHVECVDTWFGTRSTCPLCRCRVDSKAVLLVEGPEPPVVGPEPGIEAPNSGEKPKETKIVAEYWNPPRFIERGRRVWRRHSSAGENSSNSLQIVIDRVGTDKSVRRKSIDGGILRGSVPPKVTSGCFDRTIRNDGLLLEEVAERGSVEQRFGHRIIASIGDDVNGGSQRRWSDLRPSDLLFLTSGMSMTESERYSVSRDRASGPASIESGDGGKSIINSRSSELTGVRRFPAPAKPLAFHGSRSSGGCSSGMENLMGQTHK